MTKEQIVSEGIELMTLLDIGEADVDHAKELEASGKLKECASHILSCIEDETEQKTLIALLKTV
jgi:hypothetical protein